MSNNENVAKVPNVEFGWDAIDIFLFSNGQQYSPPRKYHLRAQDLDWWDATLSHLSKLHYGSSKSVMELYTLDGQQVKAPLELCDGMSYVAVVPPDTFTDAGYEKYLMRASRSLEKRKAKKDNKIDEAYVEVKECCRLRRSQECCPCDKKNDETEALPTISPVEALHVPEDSAVSEDTTDTKKYLSDPSSQRPPQIEGVDSEFKTIKKAEENIMAPSVLVNIEKPAEENSDIINRPRPKSSISTSKQLNSRNEKKYTNRQHTSAVRNNLPNSQKRKNSSNKEDIHKNFFTKIPIKLKNTTPTLALKPRRPSKYSNRNSSPISIPPDSSPPSPALPLVTPLSSTTPKISEATSLLATTAPFPSRLYSVPASPPKCLAIIEIKSRVLETEKDPEINKDFVLDKGFELDNDSKPDTNFAVDIGFLTNEDVVMDKDTKTDNNFVMENEIVMNNDSNPNMNSVTDNDPVINKDSTIDTNFVLDKGFATDPISIQNFIADNILVKADTNVHQHPGNVIEENKPDAEMPVVGKIINYNSLRPVTKGETQTQIEISTCEVNTTTKSVSLSNNKTKVIPATLHSQNNIIRCDVPLDDNCIAVINKGNAVNLHLNIELKKDGTSHPQNQSSVDINPVRKVTSLSNVFKEQTAEVVSKKSLDSLIYNINDYYVKVVVVQCTCCGNNTVIPGKETMPVYEDRNGSFILMPSSDQQEQSSCICCPPNQPYPDKKTMSALCLGEFCKSKASAVYPRVPQEIGMTMTVTDSIGSQTDEYLKNICNMCLMDERVLFNKVMKEQKCSSGTSPPQTREKIEFFVAERNALEVLPMLCNCVESVIQTECKREEEKMLPLPYIRVDSATQTEWYRILLQATRHEDGRYSFHLPPLNVLKHYSLI